MEPPFCIHVGISVARAGHEEGRGFVFFANMFDIDIFISAIEERPVLYNLRCEDYYNRDKKIRLWEEVAEIMYTDWSTLETKDKN